MRFDLYGEEGYAGEKVQENVQGKVQGNRQRRKHGDPAAGRDGPDGGGEAKRGPSISDLSGENLLQVSERRYGGMRTDISRCA